MDNIIKNISPETLLAASYEHFAAYELYCARSSATGETLETAELAWAISGVLSPYMNSVVKTQLQPDTDVDACIESVLAQARKRSVPLGWFLLPGTAPADIGSKLEAHGLIYDGDDPGMSVDLHTLPDHIPAQDNLRIVEV